MIVATETPTEHRHRVRLERKILDTVPTWQAGLLLPRLIAPRLGFVAVLAAGIFLARNLL